MAINTKVLEQMGLTEEQSHVYLALLGHAYRTARALTLDTGIKRSMVYKTLKQLEELGLVQKKEEPGSIAVFYPEHPQKLNNVLNERVREIAAAQSAFEHSLGALVSDYNLMAGRPNVQFYEGESGLEHVIEDSLFSKTEILTYVDIETLEKYLHDVNNRYVRKREKLGIKKRGLVPDTPFARKFLRGYHTDITKTKFLSSAAASFETVMQIYDNKISYLTLQPNMMIGAIIEDPRIYAMHVYLFECLWNATPFPDKTDTAPATE